MKLLLTFLILPYCLFFSSPKEKLNVEYTAEWSLRKDKNGIKVYTRDLEGSNLKELKLTMTFEGTTSTKILKVLKDTPSYKNWVYNCTASKSISALSENESISYYKFDFPWPLSDREIYLKAVTVRDYKKGYTLITTSAVRHEGVNNKGLVRITDHFNQWEFQEDQNGNVNLTYFLKSNPGGKIPDWVINLAVDKGPTNTLSNLRNLLKD